MSQNRLLSLLAVLVIGLVTGLTGLTSWSDKHSPPEFDARIAVESASETNPEQRRLLELHKPGQPVSLKEVQGRYEILLIEGTPLPQKVISVGADYVTIQDAAEVSELSIPIYQLQCIRRIRKIAGN